MPQCNGHRYISTTCPAIVGYVERYYPDLVDSLAPIVSPMMATARALRRLHGDDLKVVFIGPCIAKKVEAADASGGRRDRRRAHVSPNCGRFATDDGIIARRRAGRASSIRRTAAPAGCFPSAAACFRPPNCAKT